MKPVERDIEISRGDTFPIEFALTDRRTGDSVDITGASFTLSVTSIAAPPDATTLVFDVAGVIVDAVGGLVSFTPTATDTDNVGSWYYDVQYTDASSNVRTIVRGRFVITQDRTK